LKILNEPEVLSMKKSEISIVGTGYVGLCTAVGFVSKGYKVVTSTHNREKAENINKAIPPFYEPRLKELLKEAVEKNKLKCVLSCEDAVVSTDTTFVAVGTPSRPDGSIDLKFVKKSVREIGNALRKKEGYHLVVVKSTVVPGTTKSIVKLILEKHSGKSCSKDFGLCMNPEFLRQGSAIYDTLNPDRIVIGENDRKSGDILENFYRNLYGNKMPPLVRTNLSTAEIIKYANNGFLATKISFINTIANICQKIPEADITTVAKAIGLDRRINPQFLNAGLGYGGSCFPKDVKALVAFSHELGHDSQLLQAVEQVNNLQPSQAIKLAKKQLGNLENKRIAILGLAFKPNTSDMREARSIAIINELLGRGANIVAYDPAAIPTAKTILGNNITYATSPIECLKEADCCIIVTEWDEFKKLTAEDFNRNMRRPIVIDGRRIHNASEFSKKLQFEAIGLGSP
jgi:UDPglucose 6-dehydrogenase